MLKVKTIQVAAHGKKTVKRKLSEALRKPEGRP
jgi:hypothetical protein